MEDLQGQNHLKRFQKNTELNQMIYTKKKTHQKNKIEVARSRKQGGLVDSSLYGE